MIMIPLPDDRETVTLQVLQDGNEILNETVTCADYQYTFPCLCMAAELPMWKF
ncbi:MAG: hypothetical protein ACLUIW_11405 [Dysosmobacter welbionis]